MKILSIDTSSLNFSLALCDGNKVVRQKNYKNTNILSASIISRINALFISAKWKIPQIDCFAVGLGPGSFTSLRVGLATVKAFCFATHKRMIGICSLDVIAMNVSKENIPICVIVDAKRKMLYTATYIKENGLLKRKTNPRLMTVEDLLKSMKQETIFIGDGISLYGDILKKKETSRKKAHLAEEKLWYPKASQLSLLAVERYEAHQFDDVSQTVPMYLYAKDCQVRK